MKTDHGGRDGTGWWSGDGAAGETRRGGCVRPRDDEKGKRQNRRKGPRGHRERGKGDVEEGLERSRCHFHSSAFLFLFSGTFFFPSTPAVLSTIRYISGHPRHCFRGISSELFARDSFRASTSLHPYPSPLLFLSLSIRPCECRGYRARTTLFDFTNAESRIARPRNSHPVALFAFRCFNELPTFRLFIRLRFSRT